MVKRETVTDRVKPSDNIFTPQSVKSSLTIGKDSTSNIQEDAERSEFRGTRSVERGNALMCHDSVGLSLCNEQYCESSLLFCRYDRSV